MTVSKFLLKLILVFLLAGCSTMPGPEGEPHSTPDLLPRPLRDIGLAVHTAFLAGGLYASSPGAKTAAARAAHGGRAASVTWLGHSTSIIRIAGTNVLTDPVLVPNDSPASPLPVRLAPAPVAIDGLPRIDVIVLSHGDYDHLHMPTMEALARRYPNALVLAPKGVASLLAASGYPKAKALTEGESVSLGSLHITALPVRHETRRNALGLRDGGAVSWELSGARTRILFVGDSAYGPVFSQIGATRGPYDAALVPIGAYEPRALVANMHASPEEAVQIARDVRARLAIAIHWGTFALSPDRPEDAKRRFLAAGGRGIGTRVLKLGQTLVVR